MSKTDIIIHDEKDNVGVVVVDKVNNGQECGITVKDFIDFQKNDTIEAFSVTSVERSI